MTIEEKLEIAKRLQSHHYFFRAFWDIGNPVVGDFVDLPTAAISFDEKGNSVNLLINVNFWNSLNEESRLFLICHEMLHIILDHGLRFTEYFGKPEMEAMNIATDVVINEMLCKSFEFSRDFLDDRLKIDGCWYDTVFNKTVPENESSEYYFNILRRSPKNLPKAFRMDDHNVMKDEDVKGVLEKLNELGVFGALDPNFTCAIPQKERDNTRSPTGTGSWTTVDVKAVKKKKWETVIKKWEKATIKEKFDSTDRWDRTNPRYSQIINKDVHLPTTCNVLDEYREKTKIDVFFFLDTSGSCYHLKDRFFKAAKSLDPKKFNIRLFCFDTEVKETTLESGKIYGGGGTSFGIIEKAIQDDMKKTKNKYPKAVFLITDGHGDNVTPEKPDRWFWFLTAQNSKSYIPSKSKTFLLSNYE